MRLMLVLLPLLLAPSVYAAETNPISTMDPWVREMPPVSEHSAGYVTLVNAGSEERQLVAADTPLFLRSELHESRETDGVVRMQAVSRIAVPAGGEVRLQPGGYHIMLMHRQVEPLTSGDRVPLTLRFDDGSEIELDAEVRRQMPQHGEDVHQDDEHEQ